VSCVCVVDMDDEELAEAVSLGPFDVCYRGVLTFDLPSLRCLSG